MARKQGMLRVRDLTAAGIHPEYLRRLCAAGDLTRLGRGLYAPADMELEAHHSLAEVCKKVPHGVVCLLSALRFHEIGTQNPSEVWLAIDRKAARPRNPSPPVHLVRFSGQALTYGAEEHRVEGVTVRVYGPAKTVADCFKYRNKIGLDVALEALRDVRQRKSVPLNQLWEAARVCRVANVMRPYLEALS